MTARILSTAWLFMAMIMTLVIVLELADKVRFAVTLDQMTAQVVLAAGFWALFYFFARMQ